MKKLLTLTLAAMFFFAAAASSDAAKKKVAVLDFEYGTITDRWWPHNWDIGKGLSDMLVTQLVKDGSFSVIERRKLEALVNEQKLGSSGLVNPSTAAEIGRILGVKYVIFGSVTQFSVDTKTIDTGGFGRMLGLGADVGISTTTATVYIDARMIDTTTAEIVSVAEGKASESKKGVKVAAADSYQGYGHFAIGGQGFDETLLGQATRQSIGDVVKQLSGKGSSSDNGNTSLANREITTKVADTEPGKNIVYLDAGSSEGLVVGQTFYVSKVKREIKSPTTGEIIKRVMETMAEIRITEVDGASATALVLSGNVRDIRIGDEVCSEKK